MVKRTRWILLLAAASTHFAALAGTVLTPGPLIEFQPCNPEATRMLMRVPELREVVANDYSFALVDLDDDGRAEIVVRSDSSLFCGSGGCLVVVMTQHGDRMVTLLSQNLFPGLGVTREKIGRYRALAALDEEGRISRGDREGTPLYRQQMVYPMQAPSAASAATGRAVQP